MPDRMRRTLQSVVSPRHRKWHRLRQSLTLDPTSMTSLEDPGPNDVIIAGIPRSGTALLAAMLHQPPESVSVMEPWDALRLPPAELFKSLRTEIAGGSLSRGRLDLVALNDGRVTWTTDGANTWPLTVDPDHLLAVKFPTLWQYLDLLPHTKFLLCARHPAAVLASFAAQSGTLAEGLEYDVAFNEALNQDLRHRTGEPSVRRALLYETIGAALVKAAAHPNRLIVRYEDWHSDAAVQRERIEAFLGRDLGHPPVSVRPSAHDETDVPGRLKRYLASAEHLGYQL